MGSDKFRFSYNFVLILNFLATISLGRSQVPANCEMNAQNGSSTSGFVNVHCILSRELHAEEEVIWMFENCMSLGRCNSTDCDSSPDFQLSIMDLTCRLLAARSKGTGPYIFSIYNKITDEFVLTIKCTSTSCESTPLCADGIKEQDDEEENKNGTSSSTREANMEASTAVSVQHIDTDSAGTIALTNSQNLYDNSVPVSMTVSSDDTRLVVLSPLVLACIIAVPIIALLSIIGTCVLICRLYGRKAFPLRDQTGIERGRSVSSNGTVEMTMSRVSCSSMSPNSCNLEEQYSEKMRMTEPEDRLYEQLDCDIKPPLPVRNRAMTLEIGRRRGQSDSELPRCETSRTVARMEHTKGQRFQMGNFSSSATHLPREMDTPSTPDVFYHTLGHNSADNGVTKSDDAGSPEAGTWTTRSQGEHAGEKQIANNKMGTLHQVHQPDILYHTLDFEVVDMGDDPTEGGYMPLLGKSPNVNENF